MSTRANDFYPAVQFITTNQRELQTFFVPNTRTQTVWPKHASSDSSRFGFHCNYHGDVTRGDGHQYHQYHMYPNPGPVPRSIQLWRDQHRDFQVPMASLYIPKGVQPYAAVFEHAMSEAISHIE